MKEEKEILEHFAGVVSMMFEHACFNDVCDHIHAILRQLPFSCEFIIAFIL